MSLLPPHAGSSTPARPLSYAAWSQALSDLRSDAGIHTDMTDDQYATASRLYGTGWSPLEAYTIHLGEDGDPKARAERVM